LFRNTDKESHFSGRSFPVAPLFSGEETMKLSKHDSKQSTHVAKIRPATNEETLADHQILIINSTDYVIRKFQTRPDGSIVTLREPIGRTCTSSDYDTCFDGGRYKLMLTHNCPSWIELKLWLTDSSGAEYTTSFERFDLNCDYAGIVLQLKE
jgi:hypothetical protein